MGFHGGGWFSFLSSSGEKPKMTIGLLRRVMGYARPYRGKLVAMLLLILGSTGLTLLSPLILRSLIDKVIPSGNLSQLIMLAIALLFIPAVGGALGVVQRRLNAQVGEGVIYDHVIALFHQYQAGRADEPPEQRCGGGAERHQQHHR
jgi:ATP-binding cassette subfamily B protein